MDEENQENQGQENQLKKLAEEQAKQAVKKQADQIKKQAEKATNALLTLKKVCPPQKMICSLKPFL